MILTAKVSVERRDVAVYAVVAVNAVLLLVWAWDFFFAVPGPAALTYGEPLYYGMAVAFAALGGAGFWMLWRMGRAHWRRPSAICLWMSSILVVLPLSGYLLNELLILMVGSTGGF